MTSSRAQDVVEAGLAAAGDAQAVVLVEEDSSANLRWAMNGMTTNGVTQGQGVTVVVSVPVEGGRGVGVLSRRAVDTDGVAELVEAARAVAAAGAPAEDAADLVDGGVSPDWDAPGEPTGAGVLAGVAEGLGDVLGASRAAGREAFGFAQHDVVTTWLGTTAGTRRRHVQPRGTIELTGKSHARSRSTWVGRGTRDFTDVDVRALDAQVVERLGWQARRVDVRPGRWDTVLPPEAVADFLVYLYWESGARSAHEGRSVLSRPGGGTRHGERLSDLPWTLESDPALPGLECSDVVLAGSSGEFGSVFDNGLPATAQRWVTDGVLTALPSTRFTSGLTGLPLAPAVDNLRLTLPDDAPARQGAESLEDLVAGLSDGLLVTCQWYIREVDPLTLLLTGLTRDGVYKVEGGEVVGAAPNFRFNVSPMDVLRQTEAATASRPTLSREWGEWFTRASMPALRVRDFNMSSVSEAS